MARRFFGLDGTGHLDGAAKKQQLFGQGSLAGIGMRNNRKSPAAGYFIFQFRHNKSPHGGPIGRGNKGPRF